MKQTIRYISCLILVSLMHKSVFNQETFLYYFLLNTTCIVVFLLSLNISIKLYEYLKKSRRKNRRVARYRPYNLQELETLRHMKHMTPSDRFEILRKINKIKGEIE